MSITKKIASQISNTLNFIDDFYLSVDSATNGIKLEDGDPLYARYIQIDNTNNKISLIDGNAGIDLNLIPASGGGVAKINLIAHPTGNYIMLEQNPNNKITIKNSQGGILIDGSGGTGIDIDAQDGGLRVDATSGAGFIVTTGSSAGFQVIDNGTGNSGFIVNLTGAAPIDIKTNGATLNLSTVAPGNAPINIDSSGDINIRTTDTTTKQVLIAAGINSAYDGFIYLLGNVVINKQITSTVSVGKYTTADSPILIISADNTLIYSCDSSTGDISMDLPLIDGSGIVQGRCFIVKNSGTGYTVTVNAYLGQTIDGGSSIVLHPGDSVQAVAVEDGSGNYWIAV